MCGEQRHGQLAQHGGGDAQGTSGYDHGGGRTERGDHRRGARPVAEAADLVEARQPRAARTEGVEQRESHGQQGDRFRGRGQTAPSRDCRSGAGQHGGAGHDRGPAPDAEHGPRHHEEDHCGDGEQPDAERQQEVLDLAAGPLRSGPGRGLGSHGGHGRDGRDGPSAGRRLRTCRLTSPRVVGRHLCAQHPDQPRALDQQRGRLHRRRPHRSGGRPAQVDGAGRAGGRGLQRRGAGRAASGIGQDAFVDHGVRIGLQVTGLHPCGYSAAG